MTPKTMLEIVKAIRGNKHANVMVENASHAEPLAEVIFECRCLYDLLENNARLDEIVEQISKKNEAAKKYEAATGYKWPL